jgi:hypothetical protein
MTLSKSLYTRAIQCPKSLWLKKYKLGKKKDDRQLEGVVPVILPYAIGSFNFSSILASHKT